MPSSSISFSINSKSDLSYQCSVSESDIEISNITVSSALYIEKKFIGYVDVKFDDLLSNQIKYAKKDKEITIALLEKMISDLTKQRNKIK